MQEPQQLERALPVYSYYTLESNHNQEMSGIPRNNTSRYDSDHKPYPLNLTLYPKP